MRPCLHIVAVTMGWATTASRGGINAIHNMQATVASRLSASGTPDLFVAQMMGHSGTSILHVYAKAIDESRREAIKKFEAYRQSHLKDAGSVAPASPDSHLPDKQPAAPRSALSKKPFLN